MSKIPHVFVATPAYDGKVDSDFAMSLAEATQAATVFGVQVTACLMRNGAFIDLARNVFVKLFLEKEKECTHLFFIDSDLKFSAKGFVNLVLADKPVTAGVYRRRQEPEDYPVHWTPHPELSEKDGVDRLWVENTHWVQCNRVPTGFLCIKRTVIEEMAKDARKLDIQGQQGPVPQLFYTKITDDNKYQGEDYSWCDDYVARYGKQIDVLADLDFTHGGYECNWYKYLDKQIRAYEKQENIVKQPVRKLGERRRA